MSLNRVERFLAMPIFGGIRAEVMADLLRTAKVVDVKHGGYFFHEGDLAESMYVLESGRVSLLKHFGGAAHILGELKDGDCFGEMALLDLFPRSASVVAETDCSAIEINAAGLADLSKSDLEQFALIQMNIARELSRRLRLADERLFRSYIGADDLDAPWSYVA